MRDLTESHAAYGRAMLADLTRPDVWAVPEPSRFVQMKHPLNGNWWKLDAATGRVVEHSTDGPFPNIPVVGASNGHLLSLRSTVDGSSSGSASDVPATTGIGRVRPGQPGYMESIATANVAAVYDAALAIVRAESPMPLVSSEPWVESDTHLRNRINAGERGFWWPVPNCCGGSDVDMPAFSALGSCGWRSEYAMSRLNGRPPVDDEDDFEDDEEGA